LKKSLKTLRNNVKIKLKKVIYRHGKGHALKWRDIHLELKDDDVIHAAWVDDDNFDYQGYWLEQHN
jgi:hypothetical protein